MTAQEAQARMREVENHGQDWSVEQFLVWVMGLDDSQEAVDVTVGGEIERAVEIANDHYVRVGGTRSALLYAAVGFLQGATMAAAAMGREPLRAER
jgi:hypothetical protein